MTFAFFKFSEMRNKRLSHGEIIGFAIFVLCMSTGCNAISCFQCNSVVDPNCAKLRYNDTGSSYYQRCEDHDEMHGIVTNGTTNGKIFFCRKIMQVIKDMKDSVRIIRKCGWEKSPKTDCYKFEDDDHKEIVCQCFTDGCNSAHRFISPTSTLLLFTAISYIVVHHTLRLF